MEEQKYLFEILKTRIPDQYRLVDIVEEELKIGTDSVYRRIRGEKELSFSELHTLCKKFNISMDEVFNYKSGQSAIFRYNPVNFSYPESYNVYFKSILEAVTAFTQSHEKELYVTASDIPFYHLLDYPELTFFRLYTWNDILSHIPILYSDFCNKLDRDAVIPILKQTANAYQQIPSKEIWTNQTIDTILRLLEHYFEVGAFEKKEIVLSLLNQLKNLMDTVRENADVCYKGGGKQTPFFLYLSPVELENSRMLFKMGKNMLFTIRLNNVNGITTENSVLCLEMISWINDLISKSVLISGTSIKERVRFFQSSKNKIDGLIDKIELSK